MGASGGEGAGSAGASGGAGSRARRSGARGSGAYRSGRPRRGVEGAQRGLELRTFREPLEPEGHGEPGLRPGAAASRDGRPEVLSGVLYITAQSR